MSVINALLYKL